MARDGSGNYSLPALNPVVTGTAISATWANNTLTDVATALTASIAKDGQTTPTADLPMGTQKHTGVGDAAARNQYGAAGQVQDNDFNVLGSVSGTNTITGSLTPAITSYSAGMHVTFVPANTNTGAATIAINGLTTLDIQKGNAAALVAGDLVAGIPAVLVLDAGADDWILLNPMTLNGVGLTLSGNATIGGTLAVTGAATFGAVNVLGSVSGTNTITGAMTPALAAYSTGMIVVFTPANNTTGAATININSLGAKSIVKGDGTALESGDLQASTSHVLVYDGTNFVVLNPLSFSLVNGTLSGTLGVTGLTTLAALTAAGALTLNGALTTDNTTADEVGFKGIPQNTQTGAYTLVLTDAGKHILKNGAGTVTIPANASVAFPVGTAVTFVNRIGGGTSHDIAITSDSLILAGAGTAGTRTLADNGVATALKITSTVWMISGSGLS